MEIALEECERMGIQLQGLTLAKELYDAVMQSGGGKLGTQALFDAVDKMSRRDSVE